jgi:hypothetical protein
MTLASSTNCDDLICWDGLDNWKIFDGFTWTLIDSLVTKLNSANPEFVQAIRDVYHLTFQLFLAQSHPSLAALADKESKQNDLRHLICRQLESLSECAFRKEEKGEGEGGRISGLA